MQISRHWRLKAKRYRLEGVRYSNGAVRLCDRPVLVGDPQIEFTTAPQQTVRVAVKA
jgi:hypothetical protein